MAQGVRVKAPKKRGPGRPRGKSENAEESVLVVGPAALLAEARERAEREGVSVREWWRRAARERLASPAQPRE